MPFSVNSEERAALFLQGTAKAILPHQDVVEVALQLLGISEGIGAGILPCLLSVNRLLQALIRLSEKIPMRS